MVENIRRILDTLVVMIHLFHAGAAANLFSPYCVLSHFICRQMRDTTFSMVLVAEGYSKDSSGEGKPTESVVCVVSGPGMTCIFLTPASHNLSSTQKLTIEYLLVFYYFHVVVACRARVYSNVSIPNCWLAGFYGNRDDCKDIVACVML